MAARDPAARELQKQWDDAFKAACKSRRMPVVLGESFLADEVYFTTLNPTVWLPTGDEVKVTWEITIKPMSVDDILWRAFLPDIEMGPRKRLNRRVNGAFQIRPWTIGEGIFEAPKSAAPERYWSDLFAEFDRIRSAFLAEHPLEADYLRVIRTAEHPEWPHNRLREITTLIAAGLTVEAAALADAEVAAGERGPMSSDAGVYEYLAAWAKGPGAWTAFRASLVPTHHVQVLSESTTSYRLGLSRARHTGRFLEKLSSFDGTDVWALILETSAPPSAGDDPATVRYLQAAGSAETMTVEIRRPDGGEWGAVSVRSTIGHPHDGPPTQTVAIELPRSTQIVSGAEVFRAEEAADLFDHFYRSGDIPAQYTVRPIEGWAADGSHVTPNSAVADS
jgi:hypothetical protein